MKRLLPVLSAAAAVLLIGWVGWVLLFGGARGPRVVVLEQQGPVTAVRAGAPEAPAGAGATLDPLDLLQVGPGGVAVLSVGEGGTLRVEADSSVRLLSVDAEGVRVELEGGRVQATVRAGAPSLGVSSRGRAVTATDAELRVAVDATGAMGVVADRGELQISGVDGVTALRAGRELILPARGAPAEAAAVEELLLDVHWPVATTRAEVALLQGETRPHARVRVGAVEVLADAEGHFEARIELQPGANPVQVSARDAFGRTSSADGEVLRAAAPPLGRAEVVWGGAGPPR